jgi:glucose-6-phosphate 1-dehydrogenase
MRRGEAKMIFRYEDSFRASQELEAYEYLILDAMQGDQSLFTTAAGVEQLWEISTPLLEHPPPIEPYTPGSWGPPPSTRSPRPTAGTSQRRTEMAARRAKAAI